jgi:hypothetical protein
MSSNERTAFPAIPAILGLDPTRERPRAANPMSSNGRTGFPPIPVLGLGKLASKTSVQESPLHVVPEQVLFAMLKWRDRFTACGGHPNRRDTVCSCDEPRAGVMSVSPFRFQAMPAVSHCGPLQRAWRSAAFLRPAVESGPLFRCPDCWRGLAALSTQAPWWREAASAVKTC